MLTQQDMDQRERYGYRYKPNPVNTDMIKLPPEVRKLSELIAANCHDVWARGRISEGWQWGEKRNNESKLHPDLIPYDSLTEETKEYDRSTATQTLKAIMKFGYNIVPVAAGDEAPAHQFGMPVPRGETYEPLPVITDGVELSPGIRQLGEMLAANTHDVWAKSRMEQGWTYGPERDDDKKKHNCLVPYAFLTSQV